MDQEQTAKKDDRHEWARVHDLRPGAIVTTEFGVVCVLVDRPVLLDDDDDWGLAATIIGPPTHPKIGHGTTLRFDERVKPQTLPTEIQQALHVVPRTPTRDDVVPRTTKDQQRLSDDHLGLRLLLEHGKKSIGTKTSTSLTFSLNDLERLQRVLDQGEAVTQQAIETHDALTAANVSDAKTLRERVELGFARIKERLDAAVETVGRVQDVCTKAGVPINMHVHERVQYLVEQNSRLEAASTFGFGNKQSTFYLKLEGILGRINVTNADREAVTDEDTASGPDAREYYAKRMAMLRTITDGIDAISERQSLHEKMQRAGYPVDPDGWMTTSMNRLLAKHEALHRVQVAYSKVDVIAANAPDMQWVSNLEQYLVSTKTQAAMAKGWTDTFKTLEQVANAFAQMRAKTWITIAALRRCTNDRPTLTTPDFAPCASLIDAFNNVAEWHAKSDRELHDLGTEEDTLERRVYLEGRATSYIHAMDLIVAIGRAGYELVKQQ